MLYWTMGFAGVTVLIISSIVASVRKSGEDQIVNVALKLEKARVIKAETDAKRAPQKKVA